MRGTTAAAILVLGLAFLATTWAASALALVVLVILAILIDGAAQTNQVVSQRVLFAGAPETRGRINAIFMTMTFAGGAVGSVLSTVTYHWGGWNATAAAGGLIAVLTLLLFATERRGFGFIRKKQPLFRAHSAGTGPRRSRPLISDSTRTNLSHIDAVVQPGLTAGARYDPTQMAHLDSEINS